MAFATAQVLVGASPNDAITRMACRIRRLLEPLGPSTIHALHRHPDMIDRVEALDRLANLPRDSVVIYHSSIGDPRVTELLLDLRHPLVMQYHNITPADALVASDPGFASLLQWGRHELEAIRPKVQVVLADSLYNAAELEALGYRDVTVVPSGLDVDRLSGLEPDQELAAVIRRDLRSPLVITVGQVLPHKRPDLAIHAHHVLRTHHHVDAAWAFIGQWREGPLLRALRRHLESFNLDRFWLTGAVSDEQLLTYLSLADVLVVTSDHEGLCIPPLEAMTMGVPVVARRRAALPQVLGAGALFVDEPAGAVELAEAVAFVLEDAGAHASLAAAGAQRVAAFDAHSIDVAFLEAFGKVL